jgi:hypothetical protein
MCYKPLTRSTCNVRRLRLILKTDPRKVLLKRKGDETNHAGTGKRRFLRRGKSTSLFSIQPPIRLGDIMDYHLYLVGCHADFFKNPRYSPNQRCFLVIGFPCPCFNYHNWHCVFSTSPSSLHSSINPRFEVLTFPLFPFRNMSETATSLFKLELRRSNWRRKERLRIDAYTSLPDVAHRPHGIYGLFDNCDRYPLFWSS